MIDLGRWASGEYVIPGPMSEDVPAADESSHMSEPSVPSGSKTPED